MAVSLRSLLSLCSSLASQTRVEPCVLIPLLQKNGQLMLAVKVAEREGFEPPEACASPVFKTGTLNHSDISPKSVL